MGIVQDYEDANVCDQNELDLGRIKDFTINDDYEIQHFILEGDMNMIKDELEIKGNYKLLIPPSMISRKDDKEICLNVTWRELKTIEDIEADVVKFSNLRNIDVIDVEHENIGRVIDAIVHSDNHISFIIGGSPFNEFLKRIGIFQKVHMLLPYRYIYRMDSNLIKLKKQKKHLGSVLNDIILDANGVRLMDAREEASYESRLTLYKESYQDVLQSAERRS
jgi:hypothetical protein